ncbi:methyltransferase domain-containing protein [Bacillus inaquosorum]|uniref:methyltransferase domain-containing protein n=1 Tax=Bacillus inaquosorum TaxID=483913 RepID=UPI002282330A|nr:methyltransferase domain-containing protein [Bacillus inaquosorum]MCY7911079.1 class I SAM-dependent methyltransferase [Bacillus inaquosorum]MCY8859944.1 class I SAM-dependent methyltransferase [Bacillus inaquosorum]MCY8876299.1 class I SAM-dependent methyltransferase [Bacillus inaquosorum]
MEIIKDLEVELGNLDYVDFISRVNQYNIPPGSLSTVSEWIFFSNINSNSKVIEIACNTGVVGREISLRTGAKVKGIDVNEEAVKAARKNKKLLSVYNCEYEVLDFFDLPNTEKFTHATIGASLGFFKNKVEFTKKLTSIFDDKGYLLASPYYSSGNMPAHLIEESKQVLGITPTSSSYKEIMKDFSGLEVVYESRKNIIPEEDYEMKQYAKDTTDFFFENNQHLYSKNAYNYIYNRLLQIKEVSNELHKYQSYSVMVLRYDQRIYPKRLVELF